MGRRCGFGIDDHPDRGPVRTVADERVGHAHRVRIATGAGVVLRVGDHHRAGGRKSQAHRLAHAAIGIEDLALEGGLARRHPPGHGVGRCIRLGLRGAIGHHGGAAIREISGRETGQEGQAGYALAFEGGELGIDRPAGLHCRGLPGDRNEIGNLAERFGRTLAGPQKPGESLGGA